MKKIVYGYSVIALFFAVCSVGICETIWLPAPSGSDNWIIPIGNNVLVVYEGKKHILENATIEGEDIKAAQKYELDLSTFIGFRVDEYILNSDYDIKKDNRSFHCNDCVGRSEIYIPIHKIHKISFPKKMIAEIYFNSETKPFYAYHNSIIVRGDEDLGAFGKSKIDAYLGLNNGDEIILPDRLPVAEINKKSDLSCMVTMEGGRKVSLDDCRPNELDLVHNGARFSLSTKKISRIDYTGRKFEFLIELKTGEKQELILERSSSSGICGKGKQWYEEIYWQDIKTIVFK